MLFKIAFHLVALAAEGATLSEPGLTTRWLAENCLAAWAHHDGLGVAEHRSDVEAALALDVHEEGVGGLDEALLLVLELLELRRRVQQVDVILQHHRGRLGFARAPRSLVSGRDTIRRGGGGGEG